jgi:hypothetical protein
MPSLRDTGYAYMLVMFSKREAGQVMAGGLISSSVPTSQSSSIPTVIAYPTSFRTSVAAHIY